jgi:hypothetical protein
VLFLLAPGCALKPRTHRTNLTYTFPGHTMVHMAVVPPLLADGSSAEPVRGELLDVLAREGFSYTLVEEAVGDWRRMEDESIRDMRSDLLVVHGPPILMEMLHAWLTEKFAVEEPLLVSIPDASPLTQRAARSTRRPDPARTGQPAPGSAPPPDRP